MPEQLKRDLLHHTAIVVAAYVEGKTLDPRQLSELLKTTYAAFAEMAALSAQEAAKPVPAVPIKKSVFPDYIICLEDGKKMKMLKRHLKTAYNLTPEQYREKWGLPFDYPMVAPNYGEKRSHLAKKIGLGKPNRKVA